MAKEQAKPLAEWIGDKPVVFTTWNHEAGKFPNFQKMHASARTALQNFQAKKASILANADLSPQGKKNALGQAVAEFDQLHQRWKGDPVKGRKGPLEKKIRELRGGRPRAKDDVAGQLTGTARRHRLRRVTR